MSDTTGQSDEKLTVYYDGSCPLCTAEISHYQRLDKQNALHLVDVSSDSFSGEPDLSREAAMARFHVRTEDGRQVSGARGFIELWRVIPQWRPLARLASLPGVALLLEGAYRVFLKLRPLMVRNFTRCQRMFDKT
ncbi:DUF393 domain-containing protein [Shimia sp. SDUM112013]|uniref:thiol-disulfide oxidoreductase DCC family protein n=1 Tax=Shimia sp. SDUM112013 TaxID=3136160 RepID=UPI0032EC5B83